MNVGGRPRGSRGWNSSVPQRGLGAEHLVGVWAPKADYIADNFRANFCMEIFKKSQNAEVSDRDKHKRNVPDKAITGTCNVKH